MPVFGRIGRHSNRSQNALATAPEPSPPPASASPSGPGTASGAGQGVGPGPGPGPGQLPGGSVPSSSSSTTAGPGVGPVAGGHNLNLSVPASAAPSSAPPSATSSSLSAASGASPQQQQQQQQQQAAAGAINTNNNLNHRNIISTSTVTTPSSGSNTANLRHSASPTAVFSQSEALDRAIQQQQQQQQQALSHDYNNPATASPHRGSSQLHNPAPVPGQAPPGAFDPRFRNQDFSDSVSRSQSQRYSTTAPLQVHPHYGVASNSVDDLQSTLHPAGPGGLSQDQGHAPPAPAPAAQPEKRSTRRLIKNILTGSGRDHHHHHQQQSSLSQPPQSAQAQPYDNTGGLARRPSKRVSNPPSIRTGPSQLSQVSLDQPSDWAPPVVQTQPSPLQGYGEAENQYFGHSSNRDTFAQTPQDANTRNSVRYVSSDLESSPYEDSAYQQQQHQQQHHSAQQQPLQQQGLPLLQTSPDQQDQYGQAAFDSSPQQQHYQRTSQAHEQYPGGPPPIFTDSGHLSTNSRQQNPETSSQLSHESPIADLDARSGTYSNQHSPAVHYASHQATDSPVTLLPPNHQQREMAPGASRRQQDSEKSLRGQSEAQAGAPPNYRQSQPPMPTGSSTTGQGAGLRAIPGPERQPTFDSQSGDQGRNSPQPTNVDRDAADPDKFKELLVKYKNVKRLYFDGKSQIENLGSQIEQLQNAVANQRITQSRTALDDSEYLTRFNRLNGAINNLSFNIRKDWKSVPQWLDRYVSSDALKTGRQEMTAVGRAVITRWIVEEIFNKCFHPGLSPGLSQQLKEIELSIRRNSYTMNAREEFDALTAKIVSWRMATLEGLQRTLNSLESEENRAHWTNLNTAKLTTQLYQYLAEPPPPGVDGSASMIVELAVGIAANMPLESRDVAITYPLPGDAVNVDLMDVEKTGLPPVETASDDAEDDEADTKEKTGGKGRTEKSRSGMFSALLGGGGGGSSSTSSFPPRKSSLASSTDAPVSSALPPKDSNKVRFAAFLAVEVRGRQVLTKAPVWTLG
ncbi:hypothetical protein HYQ45_018280 [Verticillium longisporum]|uniref:S-adenosylmethionine-dependent methyltransferase-like protein n=1 Tax=Verticillium longisporum TaxID=100787 RepID=A0A8I2Z4U3_VERLO|nr:hypothetical protein HYQ45_018280 [Verticillium longisporum]